jgi:hypothetical protein
MVEVALAAVHPPEAGIVFVTLYVPGELAVRSIWPVEALIKINPDGDEENVPAEPAPVNVGVGLIPPAQYGVPE